MSNGGSGIPASRATTSSRTGTTVALRSVDIYLVKSPGAPNDNTRGIEGVDWSLFDGTIYSDMGTTAADGKITVQLAPGQNYTLEALGSAYEITLRTAAAESATTTAGSQRRLRMIGYQIGHAGPHNNGVDGTVGRRTDRAIQDFQADQGLRLDGTVGTNTRNALNTEAGV